MVRRLRLEVGVYAELSEDPTIRSVQEARLVKLFRTFASALFPLGVIEGDNGVRLSYPTDFASVVDDG
jgi:hypothetical protein